MKVTNWDKWQSFRKDRGTPPWIKLHRNLFSNPEWVTLSDAERGQLVVIWLLSADKDGEIPDDPNLVARMGMMSDVPDLNRFAELGFLTTTCQPLGAKVTHQSRVEKSRVDKPLVQNSVEFERFWLLYPRKESKKRAKTAFLNLTKSDQQALIEHIPIRIEKAWKDKQKQFIPLLESFIHARRWEDDFIPAAKDAESTSLRTCSDNQLIKMANQKNIGTHGLDRGALILKLERHRE